MTTRPELICTTCRGFQESSNLLYIFGFPICCACFQNPVHHRALGFYQNCIEDGIHGYWDRLYRVKDPG